MDKIKNADSLLKKIPGIDCDFIASKENNSFDEVLDDFKNAHVVRILSYSNISPEWNERTFGKLSELRKDANLRITLALAGLFREKDADGEEKNSFNINSIENKVKKMQELFTSPIFPKDTVLAVCFNNHAKIIGTENVLYVGSANYTDSSAHNYEAGFIVRDKAVIDEIFNDVFDKVQKVEFKNDFYDLVRLVLLDLRNSLDMLQGFINDFVVDFWDRERLAQLSNAYYTDATRALQSLYDYFDTCNGYNQIPKILEKMKPIDSLFDLEDDINTMFNSDYSQSTEAFYEIYEDYHMKKKGVYAKDQYVGDLETPYKMLWEEEYAEEITSEYWTEIIESNESFINTNNTIAAGIDALDALLSELNSDSFERFTEEVKKVGVDESIPK